MRFFSSFLFIVIALITISITMARPQYPQQDQRENQDFRYPPAPENLDNQRLGFVPTQPRPSVRPC